MRWLRELRHELRDPNRQAQWLSGIARNVCANWWRRHGREVARCAGRGLGDATTLNWVDEVPDDVDLEVELERDELGQLLDRALALLPPLTRHVLIARYVEESPQAEVANRLGLSEGAVAMKLQRGKLAMRRVLSTELRQAALAYGLVDGPDGDWQWTRLWCPLCGQRRMLGHFLDGRSSLELRCPVCCPATPANVASASLPELFRGARGFRAAYARLLGWASAWIVRPPGTAPRCPHCRRPARLAERNSDQFSWWGKPSYRYQCIGCDWRWDFTLTGFVLSLPAGQRFRQSHPRLRSLPVRQVEAEGLPALVATLEDVAQPARLEIVCHRDTLQVLHVHE